MPLSKFEANQKKKKPKPIWKYANTNGNNSYAKYTN